MSKALMSTFFLCQRFEWVTYDMFVCSIVTVIYDVVCHFEMSNEVVFVLS